MMSPLQITGQKKQLISTALKIDVSDIDSKKSFIELGQDSMSAVIMAVDLEDILSIEVEPTAILESRNLELLAEYLSEKMLCLGMAA